MLRFSYRQIRILVLIDNFLFAKYKPVRFKSLANKIPHNFTESLPNFPKSLPLLYPPGDRNWLWWQIYPVAIQFPPIGLCVSWIISYPQFSNPCVGGSMISRFTVQNWLYFSIESYPPSVRSSETCNSADARFCESRPFAS